MTSDDAEIKRANRRRAPVPMRRAPTDHVKQKMAPWPQKCAACYGGKHHARSEAASRCACACVAKLRGKK